MKITKMVMSQKDKNKIHIYLDNEYFTDINVEVVYKLNLKKDKEIDLELLDKIKAEEDFNKCYTKALTLLSKTLKTKKQLKDYLYQKEFSTQTINMCIEKLEKINLINDDNYCKRYIEQEKSKKGKLAIKNSLILKGINKETIEKNLIDIDNQKDAINTLIKKYMKNKTYDMKNIQKLKRYLLSKGFSYNEINSCVGENDESWD